MGSRPPRRWFTFSSNAANDLSRENILRQALAIKDLELPMLSPGIQINTSPDNYFLIRQMQLARFNGEMWEPFGDLISGRTNKMRMTKLKVDLAASSTSDKSDGGELHSIAVCPLDVDTGPSTAHRGRPRRPSDLVPLLAALARQACPPAIRRRPCASTYCRPSRSNR
jgi:hypothetical protein